jgi:hypothetical protein
MPEPGDVCELRRAVLGRRRRVAHLLVLVLPLPLVAALAVVLRSPAPQTSVKPTPIVIAPTFLIQPEAFGDPAPPEVTPVTPRVTPPITRPACPPPRLDAPRVTLPKLDEQMVGVSPSRTNAGWIAAWSEEHAYISVDAGATFTRVLDGPGRLRAMSFDCYGRAIALRDDRVGIRDGASETWKHVPGLRLVDTSDSPQEVQANLVGGGPDIVVLGTSYAEGWIGRLAISNDAGESWRFHELGQGFEPHVHHDGRQDADGTIHVAIGQADCSHDDLFWATIRTGTTTIVRDVMPELSELAIYGDVALSEQGVLGRSGSWKSVEGFFEGAALRPLPGPYPVLINGNSAYRVRNGKAKELPLMVQGDPRAMDPAGRIWSIACGHLLIARRDPVDLAGEYGCGADI